MRTGVIWGDIIEIKLLHYLDNGTEEDIEFKTSTSEEIAAK